MLLYAFCRVETRRKALVSHPARLLNRARDPCVCSSSSAAAAAAANSEQPPCAPRPHTDPHTAPTPHTQTNKNNKGLPFAVAGVGDLLALFRCVSCRYRFATDAMKPALMGAIGRVYTTCEVSLFCLVSL